MKRIFSLFLIVMFLTPVVFAGSWVQLDDENKTVLNTSNIETIQVDDVFKRIFITLKGTKENPTVYYSSYAVLVKDYKVLSQKLLFQEYDVCVKNGGGKSCEVRR